MIRNRVLSRNFQTQRRMFDGFCLWDVGYFPAKTEFVDRPFKTFNYSIILNGRGSYRYGDFQTTVTAPCVLTQRPGANAKYGPPEGETWEELYFILPPEKLPWIEKYGLLGENPLIWQIHNHAAVIQSIRALLSLLEQGVRSFGYADLMDHLAQRVIMESLLPGNELTDSGSKAVAGLMQAMAAAPEKQYDFQEIALDYGISYSTFQRRWRKLHEMPPGQYLLNLRISECCRLLAETSLSITVIGNQLGFEDSAYFSRVFKKRIGVSPTEYRLLRRAF